MGISWTKETISNSGTSGATATTNITSYAYFGITDEETNSYKWHRYMEGIVKKGETHPNPAYQKMILSDII